MHPPAPSPTAPRGFRPPRVPRVPGLPRTWRIGATRLVAALALGAALGGCSAVKLSYNNAPEMGYWWLDNHVDFRDDQTPAARARLAELLAWHRANELPELAGLLEDAARRAPDALAPAEVCAVDDAVRQRILATARQASASAATLVAGLDAAQVRRLEEKFAKSNADYAKEWLAPGPEGQRRKRYDKDVERFEDFYGRLDASQRDVLREFAERSVSDPQRTDAERRRQQQEVLTWLRDPAHRARSEGEVRAAIDAYARRGIQPETGAWGTYRQALRQENCRKIAALHGTTRPEQRERAARRLQGYAQDLRELAATP